MPNWKKVLTSGSAGELASLFATSITGSLLGTASFAISASRTNSALSSSFATTASFAQTASYSQNLQISGSINNVDYIDFDTTNIIGTNAPAWKEGRVFYDSGSGALAVYNWEADVTLNVGQEQWLRARNQTGVTITNGSVVRLLGAIGDRPTVALAQSTDQTNTFSTGNEIVGIATHDIETGTDGFITTFGLVNGLNTAAFTVGDLLWVSQSAGQFTNVPPPTPFDRTFVGVVTRVNASNGSVFSTPLTPIHFHDISSVSASVYQQGDLWMYRSGSAGQANAWINTKALSGSYDITGSLTVSGSSRVIGTLNADGVQFIRQYNNNGNWFGGSLSVGKSVGATATLDVSGSAIITGSLNVAAGITGSGLQITGSTTTDLVRITQTGTGNAFVVEDSANPDTSPFVINNNGSVGIGTTTPSYQLDIKSNDPQLRVYADTNNRAFRLIPSNGTIESDNTSFYINRISTNDILLGIGGGKVGIGNSTPQLGFKLDVLGQSVFRGDTYISGSLIEFGATSYKLSQVGTSWINSGSGNLGIGTTTPNAKLDVTGNAIITGSLNVSNSITASAYTTNDALITSTTLTANTGITTIYSIPTASYDGAWFDYTIRSGSNARAGTIFGMWSGSAVNYAETTTTDFGSTSNFTFGMSINGSNMILSSSATTNGWTVNSIIRSI